MNSHLSKVYRINKIMNKLIEKLSWFYVTHIGRLALAAIVILFSGIALNFWDGAVYPLIAGGAVVGVYFLIGMYYAIRSMFKKD